MVDEVVSSGGRGGQYWRKRWSKRMMVVLGVVLN